jgi:hypothetical protein
MPITFTFQLHGRSANALQILEGHTLAVSNRLVSSFCLTGCVDNHKHYFVSIRIMIEYKLEELYVRLCNFRIFSCGNCARNSSATGSLQRLKWK